MGLGDLALLGYLSSSPRVILKDEHLLKKRVKETKTMHAKCLKLMHTVTNGLNTVRSFRKEHATSRFVGLPYQIRVITK